MYCIVFYGIVEVRAVKRLEELERYYQNMFLLLDSNLEPFVLRSNHLNSFFISHQLRHRLSLGCYYVAWPRIERLFLSSIGFYSKSLNHWTKVAQLASLEKIQIDWLEYWMQTYFIVNQGWMKHGIKVVNELYLIQLFVQRRSKSVQKNVSTS